jgi:hypothetical protein
MDSKSRILNVDDFSEIIYQLQSVGSLAAPIPEGEITRDSELYPPDISDLYRLYRFAVDNCVLSILEIGSGWSTFALYLALQHNIEKYSESYFDSGRFTNLFKMVSVDSSRFYFEIAKRRIRQQLKTDAGLSFHKTRFEFEYHLGIPVSFMNPSPRWDFDLIYLDAPEPEQVFPGVNTSKMNTGNDLPINGDLLRFEPYILPSTSVIIDGRTSNSRFLASRLVRCWDIIEDIQYDFSLFTLSEEPLGSIHSNYLKFRKEFSVNNNLNNIMKKI